MLVGVKGGVGWSGFAGGVTAGADAKMTYPAGGFLRIRFNETLAYQLEVLIGRKGADQESGAVVGDSLLAGPLRWNYTLVDVPALVVLYLPAGPGFARVAAGPVLSMLRTAEVEGAVETLDIEQISKASLMDVVLSAGYELPWRQLRFGAEARYALGLNHIDDVPLRDVFERRHRVFAFLFEVGVDLKR